MSSEAKLGWAFAFMLFFGWPAMAVVAGWLGRAPERACATQTTSTPFCDALAQKMSREGK